MTVFVCVDDNFGMTFNKRRQSRDSVVLEKIKEVSSDGQLYITPFSQKLFDGDFVKICSAPFEEMGAEDYCFVEDMDLSGLEGKIDTLVLFKWNRKYPFDMKLEICLDSYKLKETYDFVGNSHDKITCEVWTK